MGSTAVFSDNVIYSASATAIEVDLGGPCETSTCLVRQQRNIFIGFRNNKEKWLSQRRLRRTTPIRSMSMLPTRATKNSGSAFDHNTTFHAKCNWSCPAGPATRERCVLRRSSPSPTRTWHLYGYGDTKADAADPAHALRPGEDQSRLNGAIWTSVGAAVLATCGVTTWRIIRTGPRDLGGPAKCSAAFGTDS